MKWLKDKIKKVVEAAVAQIFGSAPSLQAPELPELDELRAHPPDLGPFIRQSVEETLRSSGGADEVPGDVDDRQ